MKAILNKREIARKKKLASKYKGISYDVNRDEFIVRLRIGTDINLKPIYFKPIRRYNEIDKAVQCLEEYKELAANNLGRKKIISFKTILDLLEKDLEETRRIAKQDPESVAALESGAKSNKLLTRISALKFIRDKVPKLFNMDLRKIEEGDIQDYYEYVLSEGSHGKDSTVFSYFKRLRAIVKDNESGVTKLLKEEKIKLTDTNFRVIESKSRIEKDVRADEKVDEKRYTIYELNKLLKTAFLRSNLEVSEINDKTLLMIILLIATGARIGELLNIGVDRISYDKVLGLNVLIYRQRNRQTGRECIVKTKQSNRQIPICNFVFVLLNEYIEKYSLKNNDKLFFTSKEMKNVALSDTSTNRYIRLCEEAAEIKHIKGRTNHVHRNGLITFFEGVLGIDEGTVRYFCGHSKAKDAHSNYFKDDDDEIRRIRARRFRAAQSTYFLTILNNYSAEKAMEIYKKCYNAVEEAESKVDNVNKVTTINVKSYDIADYEEMAKMEDSGKTFLQVAAEMSIFDRGIWFDDDKYEAYKIWRKQLAIDYRNSNIEVKNKFKTFEEFQKEYNKNFKKWAYTIPGLNIYSLGDLMEEHENEIKEWRAMVIENMITFEPYMKEWYELDINIEYRKNNSFEDCKKELLSDENSIIKEEYINYILKKINDYQKNDIYTKFCKKLKEYTSIFRLCVSKGR